VIGAKVERGAIELDVSDSIRVRSSAVVNSAGLYAPRVARSMRGLHPRFVPNEYFARGHYFTLARSSPFQHLVYPMPAPGALGIHVTLDLAGRARFGPDITWIEDVDYAFDETRAPIFYDAVRRYYPGLADEDLEPGYVGIRPKLVPEGARAADFAIHGSETHGVHGLVNLFGIESPGLTACLAIADEVALRLG
jgi:L-2-hydroxyglutarate oxidase LhgO